MPRYLPIAMLALVNATAAAQGRSRPSQRAVEFAHQAQRQFETFRRARAEIAHGGSGPCEERIGRFCYWDNNGEGPPPKEPREVAPKRRQLLARLAAAAAAAPSDDWVAGQRVRYLVEDRQLPEAAAAARECRGTPWWCEAVLGLALHEANDHAGAAAAFDSALALMPPEQRCAWDDVSSWMSEGDGEYEALGCGAARDSATRHFTWLARPLWILPGDDARSELLARRVMMRILSASPQAYDTSWGGDLADLTLRYAWPVAWSRDVHLAGESTIGHEPAPSYDVTPSERARRRPLDAEEGDWEPKRRLPRMRYAPRYARRPNAFGPLDHQLVMFRRGESLLVAVGYDLGADSAWGHGDTWVGVVLAASPTRELARAVEDSASRTGVLLARMPREPAVASVEAWTPKGSWAARSRYAVKPLAADARVSSLALLRAAPRDSAALTERVLLESLGTRTVRVGEAVYLYWEVYGAPTPGDFGQVSLSMARLDVPLFQRLASRIHLAPASREVTMRWRESGGAEGAGRSLALRIPDIPAGTYRLDLAVGEGAAATTSAVVRVLPADRR